MQLSAHVFPSTSTHHHFTAFKFSTKTSRPVYKYYFSNGFSFLEVVGEGINFATLLYTQRSTESGYNASILKIAFRCNKKDAFKNNFTILDSLTASHSFLLG